MPHDPKYCLLLIDMQRDFIEPGAPAYTPGGREMIPRVEELLQAARRAGIPVVHTMEVHRPGGMDMGREADEDEPAHCVFGTAGVEIVPELAPLPHEPVIIKRRYSAFLDTDLIYVLNGLGIFPGDTLIIAGLTANVCIQTTAWEAYQRDYRIHVVRDCTAGATPELTTAALDLLNYIHKGNTAALSEILAILQNARP